MYRCELTIKNYRCFEDTTPVVIDLGDGLTAFVGPNNSGKSALLRLFYELRHVWATLAGNIGSILRPGTFTAPLNGVIDPEEIFCNRNTRPLALALRFHQPDFKPTTTSAGYLCQLDLTLARGGGGNLWQASGYIYNGSSTLPIMTANVGAFDGTNSSVSISGVGGVDCAFARNVLSDFANSLYVGPFRNAINEGAGTHFDLVVGTSFIAIWHQWKNGGLQAQMRAIGDVTRDLEKIFEFERLEINAAEAQKTLNLIINNQTYRLAEVGSGIAQFIVVLGNAAIKRPPFILIDEPELNLHPALQVDFLTSLASYAKKGVIFATH